MQYSYLFPQSLRLQELETSLQFWSRGGYPPNIELAGFEEVEDEGGLMSQVRNQPTLRLRLI